MKKPLLHLVTAVTLLSSPNINFAQAPGLGTAANFILFSSDGAVGNAGTSILTGNVGTDNGAITAFGNVNGVMHNHDATTGQCVIDLLSAYNQLNSATPSISHALALGNGETLNAGIYLISGDAILDANLILDGQGNAGAVFIFQIQGTFSANTSPQVSLINNAKACNVFWKVEGVVSLAAGTVMKGTIVANNAAIGMGSGVSLEGRAFSTAGEITINALSANTPIGCATPLLAGPPAPALASTACYALFSSSGSVTNSDDTYVMGDIGTNVGLTSGYDPLKVTGIIHPVPDISTGQCVTDLLSVSDYLNNLSPDIELLFPEQFGNGLVLTPHTYIMGAAAIFTGILYLNADGNADAVFVIKITGALSAIANAKVMLVNGAQAKNVFWRVQGAVDINDNSEFKGTIVCAGAVSLKAGSALEGRALTTGGIFSTSATTTSMPAVCSILPVSWLYFRGMPVQKNVLLEWGTAGEINNGFFTIEKSSDGQRFETLATVNARGGAVNAENDYSFTDHEPYSLSFYRMSQTDNNGQKKFFRTIQVKLNISPGIKVVHYIQANYMYVQISGALPGNGSIELFSIDGKRIFSQKIVMSAGTTTYKIEKPLSKGIYHFNIESRGEMLPGGKVIVL